MRAREPDQAGYVVRDGVRIYYEVHGAGTPTVLLMPTAPIVDSRHWKAQIPYLARHYRVVTFDPRGNGRSDRPRTTKAYAAGEYVKDALAIMDETDTAKAVLAGACPGVGWSVMFAAEHPDRTLGLVAIAPGIAPLAPHHPHRVQYSFDEVLNTNDGWARQNRHYWLRNYRGYIEFHSREVLVPEPHSTKQYDDCVAWGLQIEAHTLLAFWDAPGGTGDMLAHPELMASSQKQTEELCRRVQCPVLIIHGDRDMCQPHARAERLAELTGGRLVTIKGAGHVPHARHPVIVNLLIKDFVDSVGRAFDLTGKGSAYARA